ncbi:unnamed protein product [Leptosia nina]|uniref:Beta-glucosidase n=1 Tax=Leptosia nina TaxID=320188 RepID=A0AAV1J3X8_9NEOP
MLRLGLISVLVIALANGKNLRHEVRKFPDGFLFGTATSSYQVEGAWNDDGKAESIWDRLTHSRPCSVKNCDTGDEFRPKHGGTIGIVLSATWYDPETENDVQAAEDTNQFEWGQYAHPIFSESGDFPPVMKSQIAAKSAEQGFTRSRLPEFTSEEIELVKGSSDFFGVNHYTSAIVYRNDSVIGYHASPSYYDDINIISYKPDDWPGYDWLRVIPEGFYKLLTKIREDYNNPTVFVTENGRMQITAGLEDDERVTYYKLYLEAMLDAMDEGSDVQVYTAWSLMDNFEWMKGYYDRFGLYEVDFSIPERPRTPRKSAYFFKEIIRTRSLDMHYEPDMSAPMMIDEGH